MTKTLSLRPAKFTWGMLALLTSAVSATTDLHAASNAPQWQRVTIPDLPAGSSMQGIWTRNHCETYAWIAQSAGQSQSVGLYRYDGAVWTQVLQTNGSTPVTGGSVHGVGADEVFAAFDRSVWRSRDRGLSWQLQTSIPMPDGFYVYKIAGTQNDIHVLIYGGADGQILRFNGSVWSKVYDSAGIFDPAGYRPFALTFAGPNEGYWVSCWGRGLWDGTNWTPQDNGFDFCDVSGTFATRGAAGELGWWAVGNNNFANGIRVWCFDTNTMSFGGKFGYCFSDGDGFLVGSAYGVWGAGLNDVYVVGSLDTNSSPGLSGRVYHYDGTGWLRVSAVGDVPSCGAVIGSGNDNVWVALTDATLLHYAPPVPPACLDIGICAAVTIRGQVGATYQIESALHVNGPWQAATNLTLPSSPYVWIDPGSVGQPRRFYRALVIP